MSFSDHTERLKNTIIVLDDTGELLNEKDVDYYFTKSRHNIFRMIVMRLKSAQTTNIARMSADDFSTSTYNGSYLFDNLKIYIIANILLLK